MTYNEWKEFKEIPNNKELKQKSSIEQLQDINNQIGSLSGCFEAARCDADYNFKELKKQSDKHLNILVCKADRHFYLMIIFNYFLLCITNFKEPYFLLLIQAVKQYILMAFKLFIG